MHSLSHTLLLLGDLLLILFLIGIALLQLFLAFLSPFIAMALALGAWTKSKGNKFYIRSLMLMGDSLQILLSLPRGFSGLIGSGRGNSSPQR